MSYPATERQGRSLVAYYYVKVASPKGLHIIWSQVYEILGKAKQKRHWEKSLVGFQREINYVKHRGFLECWTIL